jgi:hypothetical protein
VKLVASVLLSMCFVGCAEKVGNEDTSSPFVDADKDGFTSDLDCDDANDTIHPDAVELCDGVDNNCDSVIDEDEAEDAQVWYADSDDDGYGDAGNSLSACENPEGYVENDLDCADDAADVNPDGEEVCNDIDDDCDTEVDEDATDMTVWYADTDGDGFGDDASTTVACDQPSGTVEIGSDCDDANIAVNPDAAELCDGIDNDCSEATSEDGMATWRPTTGAATDLTSTVTGTAASPAQLTIAEGEVTFCDGTFYVNLQIEGSVSLSAQNADPTLAMLDGGIDSGSVLRILGDGFDVSLTDLSFQNGEAQNLIGDWNGSVGGGIDCTAYDGVDYGTGQNQVTLDNVLVTGNSADFGGGIHGAGCDFTISNTEIDYNSVEEVGGGLYIADGTHSLTSVTVDNNEADYGGGGILWQQFASTQAAAQLDAVLFSNNVGKGGVGGLAIGNSDVLWTGATGGGDSGFWNNSTDSTDTESGGSLWIWGSTVDFDVVDFGASSSGNDNGLYDLSLSDSDDNWITYLAEDDVSFECDADGCGIATETTMSSADSEEIGGYFLGNVVLANTTDTLNGFAIDTTGTSSNCLVKFALLSLNSAPASSNTWDVLWEGGEKTASTTGTTESGLIGLVVEDGVYYAMAIGPSDSSCDLNFNYEFNTSATDAGFGGGLGYVFVNDGQSVWGGTTVTDDFYTTSIGPVFHTVVSHTAL